MCSGADGGGGAYTFQCSHTRQCYTHASGTHVPVLQHINPASVANHLTHMPSSHRLDGYTGGVHVDTSEVQAVRWVSLEEVKREMQEFPWRFTQWFQEEIAHLQWFQAA